VTYGLYDGFEDLFDQAMLAPRLEEYWKETINWPSMVVQTGVAMMAIICLPRQFHVTVVENIDPQDLRLAKWVFPAYLALAALFVVPIALAGQMLLPSSVLPDSFVISLPLAQAHPALAVLAFIGGASAATGMVIVASVALSTMVSNDMLLPWLLRRNNAERPFEVFRQWMLSVRRVSIVIILLLAYVSYRLLGSTASLATIGQIAFAAVTTGHARRAVLEASQPPWRIRRPRRRHIPVVLHADPANCRPQPGLAPGHLPGTGLVAQQPAGPADHAADPRRGAVAGG
jgi:Na+/proline symporter